MANRIADRTDPMAFDARPAAIIAIPARNEADRIERCLAAMAVQRGRDGMPIASDAFELLVLANNCTDATAQAARRLGSRLPFSIRVIERTLPTGTATAGARAGP